MRTYLRPIKQYYRRPPIGNASPKGIVIRAANLYDLLDRHCPVVTVRRRARPMTPWFDADCRAARRHARAAERRYRRRLRRRSCSDADRQNWKAKLKEMHSVYEAKNVNYWKDEIATSQGDMRRLWRTLQSALGERTDGETGDHTADEFATFLPIRSIQ